MSSLVLDAIHRGIPQTIERHRRIKTIELLAPAGTPQKLKTAIHYRADALYLGLKDFSMRTRAGNFDLDQLEWAIEYAHNRGRRVYVCLNIQVYDSDLDAIRKVLRCLVDLCPDALIIADPSLIRLVASLSPSIPLHLSTQASVTNVESAQFWFSQGISRINIARELSIEQLRQFVPAVPGEIEAFVHGAVCIAYSGRCLLSLYRSYRDSRRGDCAQVCRWKLKGSEERDGKNVIEEDDRGSYILDSKDLCALPLLDQLVDTGVSSLKIEGRTRSLHYVAVVVDVYRNALDHLMAGELEDFRSRLDEYSEELARLCGRGFSTHFLNGMENEIDSFVPQRKEARQVQYLGCVTANNGEEIKIEVRDYLEIGREIELRDRGLMIEKITPLFFYQEHKGRVERALAGEVVSIPGRFKATPGALVRRFQ